MHAQSDEMIGELYLGKLMVKIEKQEFYVNCNLKLKMWGSERRARNTMKGPSCVKVR